MIKYLVVGYNLIILSIIDRTSEPHLGGVLAHLSLVVHKSLNNLCTEPVSILSKFFEEDMTNQITWIKGWHLTFALIVVLGLQDFRRNLFWHWINALVAFLILSVGMLGIASLQTMSLKSGHTAAMRTVAVMKVEEILESMRSNPTVLLSYAAGTADVGVDNGCSQTTVTAATCTPAQMAQDEIFRWKNSLIEALPNNAATTASVVVTPPVPPQTLSLVVVTVNWSERDLDTGNAANMNYSVTVQM